MITSQALIDDAQCFETVRPTRRPDRLRRPGCGRAEVTEDGHDDTRPRRRRSRCRGCRSRLDELTDTISAGPHQPPRARALCPYCMGLDPSDEQIAQGLGIDPDDARVMAPPLREGIVAREPEVRLSGEVECDAAYVVAGHEGHSAAVAEGGESAVAGGWGGAPGRGTSAEGKPPVFGMIQRGGRVVIRMSADVKRRTIGRLIVGAIAPGTKVVTEEYGIDARLPRWGYTHHAVCHAAGESARDEDGDGPCGGHVNTLEGSGSLSRRGLRPHRGSARERLPLPLGPFEVVHDVRRRGKALLGPLIGLLGAPRNPG